jgi:glycosyltransferase involved in cell wall biosynthesis
MTNEFDGLMVPPQDGQALALAIVRLLADADLRTRLVDNGRITAETYAWPKVTSKVLEMYEQAVYSAAGARWRQE